MKMDVIINPSGDLRHDVKRIEVAEQLGFDGVWVVERAGNPFLILTIAAKSTTKIMLGARSALAFPRSPMVMAQIAWDLARQCEGRFALGLSTESPVNQDPRLIEDEGDSTGRMREYVESLRAIWNTFQTDARLRYRGRYYQFRLMAPFFNPGPISRPAIPVHLAGANPNFYRLAGERFDGLHARLFHTPSHLRAVILPAMRAGALAEGRSQNTIELTVPALIVSGASDDDARQSAAAAKLRLARFGETREYRHVLRRLGWATQAVALDQAVKETSRANAHDLISDELLRDFAIVAPAEEVYASIVERYDGLADRVCFEWETLGRDVIEAIAASRRAA